MVNMQADAIDYKKLWNEERKKARQQKKHTEVENTTTKERSTTERTSIRSVNVDVSLPPWTFRFTESQLPLLDRTLHCVSTHTPTSIYYIQDYISNNHQQALVAWLQGLPENTISTDAAAAVHHWTRLPHAKRRVAVFVQPFPTAIQQLSDGLNSVLDGEHAPPNHVFVNEYSNDGAFGILPHADGPAYEPCTATISLCGPALLQFAKTSLSEPTTCSVLLHGGSLVVFQDDAYTDYVHSIDDTTAMEVTDATCRNASAGIRVEQSYRISLTFRHKKVL
jgi:alkylated DNA repair protein alkB family protein 6